LFSDAFCQTELSFFIQEEILSWRCVRYSFNNHIPDNDGQFSCGSADSYGSSFSEAYPFKEVGKVSVFEIANSIGGIS